MLLKLIYVTLLILISNYKSNLQIEIVKKNV